MIKTFSILSEIPQEPWKNILGVEFERGQSFETLFNVKWWTHCFPAGQKPAMVQRRSALTKIHSLPTGLEQIKKKN